MDEPIFLKNMRIFKKKSAKYMGKYALLNLMSSTLLRLKTSIKLERRNRIFYGILALFGLCLNEVAPFEVLKCMQREV